MDSKDLNHYQFKVEMACSGCSGAVERALKRVGGVDKVVTDLNAQSVDIYGRVPKDEVVAAIQKTGKKILSQ
ncbi:hypothetical protein MIR68_000299 [Amoeboaphelidium protococcarum]|nr:hypothetical protein MIR68_000299 [Amoeboaphelidium protococcarum]